MTIKIDMSGIRNAALGSIIANKVTASGNSQLNETELGFLIKNAIRAFRITEEALIKDHMANQDKI